MVDFLPQFGGVAYTLVAFFVALSIIVAVHEFGHYIVGRWSGIHADVFSLGFGPVLLSRVDRRGTRWQVALLPLGGYVKFRGDADAASASTDTATTARMSPEEHRSTMAGAPLWARTATVAAGPAFNFLFAVLVFGGVLLATGKEREPLTIESIAPLPVEHELRPGDSLILVDGRPVPPRADDESFSAFVDSLPHERELSYTVLRNSDEITVQGPHMYIPLVQGLAPGSAAADAGIRRGDVIQSVDGREILSMSALRDAVEASQGRELRLGIWRAGDEIALSIAPRELEAPAPDGGFTKYWRIGIEGWLFEPVHEGIGLGEAFGTAVARVWTVISMSASGLWHIVTGQISSCNLSGPIGIAETSGEIAEQGAPDFIWFLAVLSVAIGFLNLLPIPVLDGGHLVFYAYEALTGRPPSERALTLAMTVGLAVILSWMVFAVTQDLMCP